MMMMIIIVIVIIINTYILIFIINITLVTKYNTFFEIQRLRQLFTSNQISKEGNLSVMS